MRKNHLANILSGNAVINIQRIIRGYIARKFYRRRRRFLAARNMQRAFRGHIGRLAAKRERDRMELLRRKNYASTKLQATWRMKVGKEEYRSMRIHVLAAVELQRVYRGYLGRKVMKRRREWESATPGPERIKLGLKMIEERVRLRSNDSKRKSMLFIGHKREPRPVSLTFMLNSKTLRKNL